MTTQLDNLQDRFDRHLEVYANNGKESKRVADNLEILIKKNQEQDNKIKEIQDWSKLHGESEKTFQQQDIAFKQRIEPYLTGAETTEKFAGIAGKVFYAVGKTVIFVSAVLLAVLAIKNFFK